MEAYVIQNKHDSSIASADQTVMTAAEKGVVVERHEGQEAQGAKKELTRLGLKWNYPWNGDQEIDMATGMIKVGYMTANPSKRIACFISHYHLWQKCVERDAPIMVLEHDARFTSMVTGNRLKEIYDSKFDIVAVNDPRGATRKSLEYHQMIQSQAHKGPVTVAPDLGDGHAVPSGLPGNSAYYMKPAGAKKMIELAKQYGAWPNDALMCRQLLPGKLGCLTTYITRVEKMASTTTL